MKLDLSNAILVRAYQNYIPYSKTIKPSCEEKYLNYEQVSDYKKIIRREFIKEYERQTGKILSVWDEEENKIINEGIRKLLPLSSTYVSTLSFSINGLVHDDMNNFFSQYDICVLEPLKYHINDDFVNFNVNDTTIKGSIELSDEAILVIRKELFESLTKEEKEKLISIYKIHLFEGSLKDGVENALHNNNYPYLNLINRKESQYIEDSEIKESALKFINDFAEHNHLSKLRLFDIYTSPFLETTEDKIAQSKVSDEIKLINDIKMYYRNSFYEFLVERSEENGLEITEMDKYYLMSEYANSEEILEKIVTYLIQKIGFNNYGQLISEYNRQLIENYRTNSEIVNSHDSLKK